MRIELWQPTIVFLEVCIVTSPPKCCVFVYRFAIADFTLKIISKAYFEVFSSAGVLNVESRFALAQSLAIIIADQIAPLKRTQIL